MLDSCLFADIFYFRFNLRFLEDCGTKSIRILRGEIRILAVTFSVSLFLSPTRYVQIHISMNRPTNDKEVVFSRKATQGLKVKKQQQQFQVVKMSWWEKCNKLNNYKNVCLFVF